MASMEELVEEFERKREEQPLLGDWIIFNEVVQEEGLSQEEIRGLFSVIQPEGYSPREEKALLKSADRITKCRR